MLQPLVDHSGRTVRLATKLGAGGEGEVFGIENADGHVAKLYLKPPSTHTAAKLAQMLRVADEKLQKIAAWPVATLHRSPGSDVVGFVMPKVLGHKEVHVLYGPRSRNKELPQADWRFLCHVAMNCAAAFDTIHNAGAVVGDVNGKNIYVSPKDGTVRFIDCDSFQITSPNDRYLCGVGVPEYTPPELQGVPFAGVVRTPNHDAFGLAVLIFQLLFMGRHPFAGGFSGSGDMTQERAIKELRFAFGRDAALKQMRPPPHALSMRVLPSSIVDLFERAFSEAGVRGHRPRAIEWQGALHGLLGKTKTCPADPSHAFPSHLGQCPWCEIFDGGGPAFFVSIQQHLTFASAASDLDAIFAQLREAFAPPQVPAGISTGPTVEPRPLSNAGKGRRALTAARASTWVASLAFAACGLWVMETPTPDAQASVALAIGLVVSSASWKSWLTRRSPFGQERTQRRQALIDAQREYAAVEEVRRREAHEQERWVSAGRQHADKLLRSYVNLKNEYEVELATLSRQASDAQLRTFLKDHDLADANIKGVGYGRKQNLEAFGFQTAYDLLHNDASIVPGIGPKIRASLQAWAADVRNRFRYDPTKGVPEADRRMLVSRYRRRQIEIRGELEKIATESRSRAHVFGETQRVLRQRWDEADLRLRQAHADASLL